MGGREGGGTYIKREIERERGEREEEGGRERVMGGREGGGTYIKREGER